jgi:hypothetical protein
MIRARAVRRIEASNDGEAAIQRAVFQHFAWRSAPGVFVFHVPNGGARRRVEAAILKGLGTVPGVPDVIAVKAGRVFGLELKTERGRLSAAQRATHEAMRAAGAVVGVAAGLDEALAWLEGQGLLLGIAAGAIRAPVARDRVPRCLGPRDGNKRATAPRCKPADSNSGMARR